jgi:hypothetical protein
VLVADDDAATRVDGISPYPPQAQSAFV